MDQVEVANWLVGGGSLAVVWFFARRLIATLDRVADKVTGHGETLGRHSVQIANMEREIFK